MVGIEVVRGADGVIGDSFITLGHGSLRILAVVYYMLVAYMLGACNSKEGVSSWKRDVVMW
jgi:hypothetical protein